VAGWVLRRAEQRFDRAFEQFGDLDCQEEARVVAAGLDGVDRLAGHVEAVRQIGMTPTPGGSKLAQVSRPARLVLIIGAPAQIRPPACDSRMTTAKPIAMASSSMVRRYSSERRRLPDSPHISHRRGKQSRERPQEIPRGLWSVGIHDEQAALKHRRGDNRRHRVSQGCAIAVSEVCGKDAGDNEPGACAGGLCLSDRCVEVLVRDAMSSLVNARTSPAASQRCPSWDSVRD